MRSPVSLFHAVIAPELGLRGAHGKQRWRELPWTCRLLITYNVPAFSFTQTSALQGPQLISSLSMLTKKKQIPNVGENSGEGEEKPTS